MISFTGKMERDCGNWNITVIKLSQQLIGCYYGVSSAQKSRPELSYLVYNFLKEQVNWLFGTWKFDKVYNKNRQVFSVWSECGDGFRGGPGVPRLSGPQGVRSPFSWKIWLIIQWITEAWSERAPFRQSVDPSYENF